MRLHRLLLVAASLMTVACATESRPDDPAYGHSGGKADGTWCHIDFTSAEGTNLRVDYVDSRTDTMTAYEADTIHTADPVWVNVQGDALSSANAVHVWIGDQQYTSPPGYDQAVMYHLFVGQPDTNLDLYRSDEDTRFTGTVDGGIPISTYMEGDDQILVQSHQFAIEIDGNWQTDPVSGTHNFLSKDLRTCGGN